MAVIDKGDALSRVKSLDDLVVELGCGNGKKNHSAIGIDLLDHPGVDLVGDVYDALALFRNHSVSRLYAYHFIEHVPDLFRLLQEIERVTRPGAKVELVAPHFSNPYFYSDPTHRTFFGLYTFCYFTSTYPFKRRVPTYGVDTLFDIERVDLHFKSDNAFLGRNLLRRSFGGLFNSCTYLKELYEDSFSGLLPCYEVKYVLRRKTK